jgi:hypothetical protein
VIHQDPEAVTIHNKRSTIVLEVTKAPRSGCRTSAAYPVDEARRRIDDVHLRTGAVTYRVDPNVEPTT